MGQCYKRGYPRLAGLIEKAIVEVDSPGIKRACAFWLKASPTQGESVCISPELFHGPDVLLIAVIVVCRDRRCGSVKNSSRLRGKSVPHAGGAAPNPCGAFNLRRSGCGPEYERGRKGLRCNQGIPVDRGVVVHFCLRCENLQARVGRSSHFRVVYG